MYTWGRRVGSSGRGMTRMNGLRAAYVLIFGAGTIGVLAGAAMWTGTAFVFPSLGPTALLQLMHPRDVTSRARNTILGHAIGLACGYAALLATGLADQPPALVEGVSLARVICAALSLGLTGGLMILLGVPHAPAGATTLIVSLGIVRTPYELLIMEVAVVALTLMTWGIGRVMGRVEWPSEGGPSAAV